MTVWLRKVEGVSPVGLSVDIQGSGNFPEDGPLWVSFDYWVHTPATNPSGVLAVMSYQDAVGNTVDVSGNTLNAADPLSKNTINQVFAVKRFDGNAPWTFDFAAADPSNDGLISYIIMIQKDQCTVDW